VFITDDIVNHVLMWTNRHAADIKASSTSFRWHELLPGEFFAFIGLSLLAGIELWDEQWGYPLF